jgi:DUF4097 and DUF4098 domain-containing protein YvlB
MKSAAVLGLSVCLSAPATFCFAAPGGHDHAGVAAAASAYEQKETETVDRNFPLQDGGELRLNNFSGNIHITGSNRNNVVIHAVRRATRERLDHIQLDIRASATEINIEANKKDSSWREQNENVVETTFEIEVPQQTRLDVHAFSSDVHIEGVSAGQRLYSFSGTIRVDNAAGRLDVETFSGPIKADFQTATSSPDVRMKTFSGDIDVRLASSAQGRVDFNTFSGSLDTSLPMRYRSGSKRSMRGELGNGGASNDLEFHTFSGDVRIRD